uniref:IgLON family member 5 n=1 Tax=Chelonoidis abingdonii TaxID=106734 RepID=A0A8C0FZG1_CHEAB
MSCRSSDILPSLGLDSQLLLSWEGNPGVRAASLPAPTTRPHSPPRAWDRTQESWLPAPITLVKVLYLSLVLRCSHLWGGAGSQPHHSRAERQRGIPAPPVTTGEVSRSCSIDEEVTRVAWLNRSNILYAGNDKWSIDPRVRLLTNSPAEFSILIASVDMWDEGLYTCSFQTQAKPHTAQVYLIVHVPARITNISSAVTVNEGSDVSLLCMATGKPEPTVTWRQLRDGFTSEGEYLEITEINRQQAGEYECVTANGVSLADSKRVLITVNYPPTIKDVKDAYPPVGKPALLRCEAMAVPPAEFEWFKDDNRLFGGLEGLRIRNERTRSMLLIDNVTARHYGNYSCLASNKLGISNASLPYNNEGARSVPAAAVMHQFANPLCLWETLE